MTPRPAWCFPRPSTSMLLTHDKYRQFTSKKIADAKATSQVLICLSADSRDAVDDMVGKAQGAGGGADPGPKQDYGFMYGRSFEDPDGHHWEVMWMDVAARNRYGPGLIRRYPPDRPDARAHQFKPVTNRSSPMSKISPCLWFNGEAEEAANLLRFVVAGFPDRDGPAQSRRQPRRQGRHRAGGRVHAGRPALHGAERRHEDGIHARGLLQDRLRRSGRGRSAVGCAAARMAARPNNAAG